MLVSDSVTAYTKEERVELCEVELPPGEKRDSAGAIYQRLEDFCPRFSLLQERGMCPITCLLQWPAWYLVIGKPTLAGPFCPSR